MAEFNETTVSEARDGSLHRRDADVQFPREARDLWSDKAGGTVHPAFQIAQNPLGQIVWQARRPSSRSSCGSVFHGLLLDEFLLNHSIDALSGQAESQDFEDLGASRGSANGHGRVSPRT